MKENAIRTQVGELDLSVILFDEAFLLNLPEHATEQHRHSEYEIFFVLQGAISIEGQGRTVQAKAPAAFCPKCHGALYAPSFLCLRCRRDTP